jgi:hypothetical protein
LGGPCKANGDCASGLCSKSSDNLSSDPTSPGGVGNGLCTVDCTANAAVCGPLGGICVAIDVSGTTVTKAVCLESCSVGPALPALPVTKCHGRQDMACEPVNQAETLFACIPICISDADCGTRKCEPASGLCVGTPRTGKPLGSGCTAVRGQPNTDCASGLCLPIDNFPSDGGNSTPGVCSEFCRFLTQEACHYRGSPLDAGPTMGACVLPYNSSAPYNAGDLGLCLQLCDAPGDCNYQAPNWTCQTQTVLNGWGHSVCLVPTPD